MPVIDASSMVYAWDNYPLWLFPPLWEWLEDALLAGELRIPQPAMDEIQHVAPDCAKWLRDIGARVLPMTNEILQEAQAIKAKLGIADDQYHADGVDENDILIIATARVHQAQLVSNESKQPNLPVNLKKYKIPAVCAQFAPPPCINFLDYIKQSGKQFGPPSR